MKIVDLALEAEWVTRLNLACPKLQRLTVMAEMQFPQALPLLEGSEDLGWDWLTKWHQGVNAERPRDAACYLIPELEISGFDHFSFRGSLVASLEFLPSFLLQGLLERAEADRGGSDKRPKRMIDEPCIVLGTNGQTYGHFLIETMPRLHMAETLFRSSSPQPRILIERTVPSWAVGMMKDGLGIDYTRLVFYDKDVENIVLSKAIFPALLVVNDHFHPYNSLVVSDILSSLPGKGDVDLPRICISRSMTTSRAGRGGCQNEVELAGIAAREFGFAVVAPETLPWPQQVRMFANARVVVGEYGSAMHNTFFGHRGQLIGVINLANIVQSSLSALRQHRLAYLNPGATETDYCVKPDEFRRLLQVLHDHDEV